MTLQYRSWGSDLGTASAGPAQQQRIRRLIETASMLLPVRFGDFLCHLPGVLNKHNVKALGAHACAGIVIAVVAGTAAIAASLWWLVRQKKHARAGKATSSFVNPRVHATVSGQSLLGAPGMTSQGSGEQELIPTLAGASAIQMSSSVVRHRTSVDIAADEVRS